MSSDPKEHWRAALSQPVPNEPFQPASASIAVDIGVASASGPGRLHNTDHYLAIRLGRLQETLATSLAVEDLPGRFEEYGYAMLVADGLGGNGAGARASRVALSTLAHLAIQYGKWNLRTTQETQHQVIEQGEFLYRRVNDAVFAASQLATGLVGMSTSLTAFYIAQDDLFYAHVGHSRAFLLRNGVLIQLTGDTPQGAGGQRLELAPRGFRAVAARMLGGRKSPDVDIERIKLSSGDRLMLCTNGLTDAVDEDGIADALSSRRHPAEDCRRLIDIAQSQGSADDVTVMLGDYRRTKGTDRE
jgi:protein phosphatase